MSLLMQALKKAERAKRSHPVEEDRIKPSEEFDDVLELGPPAPQPRHDRRATDIPLTYDPQVLRLAPLDGPEDLAKPEDFAPVPPEVTPSAEAPVPAWSLTELPEVEAAAHPTPMPGAAVPPPPAPDSAEDVQRAAARAQRAHPNTWEPESQPSEPALTQRTRHAPPPPHRPASEPAPA
ncbi:MAG TPA: hypothetical protein VFF16_03020, partial [Telluria sp.]|nr:hypothetical protein [Telluria sp.]